MTTLDFGPSTSAVARLVAGVRDDQLARATPCPDYTVADLLDHIGGLALAFTASAAKQELPPAAGRAPDGGRLEDGWRVEIGARLAALAEAWRDPAAYDGRTMAGPIEMAGDEAALVALDEVVVHGWDLAAATGQGYEVDEAAAATCLAFVASFEPPPDAPPDDGGLFGPPVGVPDDAPTIDRLIAATGRDPGWRP